MIMEFIILGSGGATPIPRPLCQCSICRRARKGIGKRNHCSAFLTKANFLFDCGEDIKESLNRENIKRIDTLFLTHWHPDHSFGLREVLEANYDFRREKAARVITIYIARRVFDQLKHNFPAILHWVKDKKLARIKFLEHGQRVKAKGATITAIGFTGKNASTYGFLIEAKKRLFYAPCDTIQLRERFIPKNIDILVHELGIFSYGLLKTEISFPDMIKRIERINPEKAILTHIEEVELKAHGEYKLKEIERKYKQLHLKIAFDGLRIRI